MLMTDVEHRQSLIDADNLAACLYLLGQRSSDRPVPVATLRINSPPLSASISINFSVSELRMPDMAPDDRIGGMGGIVEPGLVIVAVAGVIVFGAMRVIVAPSMCVAVVALFVRAPWLCS